MSLRSLPTHVQPVVADWPLSISPWKTRRKQVGTGLAGVCLGTLFGIGAYEAGYAVVLITPLVWLWRSKAKTWRNLNITAIWYLFPVVKIVYLLLLSVSNQGIYGVHWVERYPTGIYPFTPGWFGHYGDILLTVYRRTFLRGLDRGVKFLGRQQLDCVISRRSRSNWHRRCAFGAKVLVSVQCQPNGNPAWRYWLDFCLCCRRLVFLCGWNNSIAVCGACMSLCL